MTKAIRDLPRVLIVLSVVGAAELVQCASAENAAAALPPASLQGKGCTDAGCHSKETKHKFLHGPVAIGSCKSCHAVKDEARHKFALTHPEEQLCSTCHLAVARRAVKHSPAAEGQCTACHDPHGSSSPAFLKKSEISDLCSECHDASEITGGKKHVHAPVEAKVCTACHEVHDSDHAKLLKAPEQELCTSCHDEVLANGKHKSIHKPVQQGCVACHDGHSTDEPKLLLAAAPALCYKCHADKQSEPAGPHDSALAAHGCEKCHQPHVSDVPALGRKPHTDLCLGCHSRSIATSDGRAVPAMTQSLTAGKVKHGPLQDGSCSGCHKVHGPQQPRLLAKAYPATFYAAYSEETYALCFSCHGKDLAASADTDSATGFRNGRQNLHFVHVNKQQKGRACRACHTAHTSDQPRMIASTVPFGEWELPIGYRQTGNGGTCESGCHLPKGYDRANPVDNSKPLSLEPVGQAAPDEDEP